jgi:hypothetical protein
MTPQSYNLGDYVAGDTFLDLAFNMREGESPMNLTGASIRLSFRSKTGVIAKALSVGSGITITNAPGGQWKIDQFDIDLAPGLYAYDVQFEADTIKTTYLQGRIKILDQITI